VIVGVVVVVGEVEDSDDDKSHVYSFTIYIRSFSKIIWDLLKNSLFNCTISILYNLSE
jgi:hypothetical protein